MQETRNNCFGSKIHNMTHCQAKIGNHECSKISETYAALVFTDFQKTEGYIFSTQKNCCWFFASDGVHQSFPYALRKEEIYIQTKACVQSSSLVKSTPLLFHHLKPNPSTRIF